MSDYLPPEILFQIFLNLPTKTLRKFLSVSKSWYALITSRPFVSAHLLQKPNRENNTFFLLKFLRMHTKERTGEFSFFLHDETQNEETTGSLGVQSSVMHSPLVGSDGCNQIVGIENGLICLVADSFYASTLKPVLWNPAIDVFVTLPTPKTSRECLDRYAFGFWFDSINSDYKVMRIVYRSNNPQLRGSYHLPPLAEVYSVNSGEWRGVNVDGIKCYMPRIGWSHAYVNGRSHWIGYRTDPQYCLILSLDMNDEVVREILIPPKVASLSEHNLKITESMGCLVLVGNDQERRVCRVWVMKKYGVFDSWTNLCDISWGQKCYVFLGFWKNGDILFRGYYNNPLFRYDPGRKSLVDLPFPFFCQNISMYAGIYEESLALLNSSFRKSGWRNRMRPPIS